MSGEPVQGRDLHASLEPLPPVTTDWSAWPATDPALLGAPLPPYRPHLYAGNAAWTNAAPEDVDPDRSGDIETGPDRSWWADQTEPEDAAWIEEPASAELDLADAEWLPESELAPAEPHDPLQRDQEPEVGDALEPGHEHGPAHEHGHEEEPSPGPLLEVDGTASDEAEWTAAPAEDFPWDMEPPVIETEPGAPAEPLEAATPAPPWVPEPESIGTGAEPAGASATAEEADVEGESESPAAGADERVHLLEPTPLDAWYHGERSDEADATWEAFGRALEEAASWGDLAASIATGQPTGEQSPPPAESVEEGRGGEASQSDQALLDLARRLEALARRIRDQGEHAMDQAMAEGDRLDASLAGFIAGFVAARRD